MLEENRLKTLILRNLAVRGKRQVKKHSKYKGQECKRMKEAAWRREGLPPRAMVSRLTLNTRHSDS